MAADPISVLDKITDALIVENEFTPEGESQPIKYKRLVIVVEYDGVSEEVVFEPSQGKLALRLLQLADEQK